MTKSLKQMTKMIIRDRIKSYNYSRVYDNKCIQQNIYDNSVNDSIVAALNGFNSCV